MSESITGNAAHYFVDRHLDSTTADKAAFIESDGLKRSLSYRQLAEESGRMAALYAAQGTDIAVAAAAGGSYLKVARDSYYR